MKRLGCLVTVLICLLAALPAVYGQSVTGQISGNVVDAGRRRRFRAPTVQLTHDLSQQVRKFVTESNGSFIFTGLVPGTYSLHVAQAGFKGYDQKGITVAAQERVDLHEIHLAVGDVTSTVEVQANAVHVATDSSDRSDGHQPASRSRTRRLAAAIPISLIMTLPGVQSLAQSYDYRGWNGGGIPGVNGGQQGQIILNMDGAASQDSGNLNTGYISPSIDAIGEVKLLVSNYTAEYGGRTAGQLTVTTKNGTPQFHGSAYDYYRHESLNANEFFNNKTNVVRPRYRYQNFGGTVGGPLIIPGTRFNKARQKLFFFFSYDKLYNSTTSFATYTMPTALEKAGDFSKTVTTTGALIPIFDPTTQTPFPGQHHSRQPHQPAGAGHAEPVPESRSRWAWRSIRRATADITSATRSSSCGRWTTRSCAWITTSRRRCSAFARLLQDYQAQNGYNVTVGPPGGAWGQFPASYHVQAAGALGTLVYTISPTLINEFSWGINRGKQGVDPLDRRQQQPEHRRRQELSAEPAAAEGRQRQSR